jgi:hypothetical protein
MTAPDHARPREFFEIVDGSLRHYRQRFAPLVSLFVPMAVAQLVVGLIGGVFQLQTMNADAATMDFAGMAGMLVLALIAWVAWTFVYLVGYGGSIHLVAADLGHQPIEWREAWRRGAARVWAMIGLGILFVAAWSTVMILGVVTLGVLFLLAIPMIWISVRLFLAYQTLLLEDLNVGDSLNRSWLLTEGNFWRGVALFVLLWILVTIVTAPASMLGVGWIFFIDEEGALTNAGAFWTFLAIGQVAGAAMQLVTAPLASLLWTHFYWDLRVRREGLDVTSRLAGIGSGPGPGPEDPPEPPGPSPA